MASSATLQFHPVLRYIIGMCDPPLLTSGSYAVAGYSTRPAGSCSTRYRLFNDRAHHSEDIPLGPCRYPGWRPSLVAFGAPWVLFFCGNTDHLYNVITRRWQRVRCGVATCVGNNQLSSQEVGADWVEYDLEGYGDCGDHIHYECGPSSERFYNIATGRVRRGAPNRSGTFLDLNAPTLTRRLCRGLPTGGSTITPLGAFLVAANGAGSTLERCGTPLERPLGNGGTLAGGGLLGNAHVIMWRTPDPSGLWNGTLAGIHLPSLKAFTTSLPANLPGDGTLIGLDASRLYAIAPGGELWAAPSP